MAILLLEHPGLSACSGVLVILVMQSNAFQGFKYCSIIYSSVRYAFVVALKEALGQVGALSGRR